MPSSPGSPPNSLHAALKRQMLRQKKNNKEINFTCGTQKCQRRTLLSSAAKSWTRCFSTLHPFSSAQLTSNTGHLLRHRFLISQLNGWRHCTEQATLYWVWFVLEQLLCERVRVPLKTQRNLFWDKRHKFNVRSAAVNMLWKTLLVLSALFKLKCFCFLSLP